MIIPIFLMNRGCPQRCLFCNESIVAGDYPALITEVSFRRTVEAHLSSRTADSNLHAPLPMATPPGDNRHPVEIAFYGGNFTGMEREDQLCFLGWSQRLVEEGIIDSVRISTRPDHIDNGQLDLLAAHHVGTVEIGIQSLADAVLTQSRRGHSAADGIRAVKMLRTRGFKTGVHLMAGLPGDSWERFIHTVEKTVALRPDMVRIHPTLVLRDTPLAESFYKGNYQPLSFSDALEACKYAVRRFAETQITVIRLGLQPTPAMASDGSIVAGPFHPAFGALVYESLFLDMATSMLCQTETKGRDVHITLSPRDLSHFQGQKGISARMLKDRFGYAGISISADAGLERGSLLMRVNSRTFQAHRYKPIPLIPIYPCRGLNDPCAVPSSSDIAGQSPGF